MRGHAPSSNARAATSTARRASSGPAWATSQAGSPVDGSITAVVASSAAGVCTPPSISSSVIISSRVGSLTLGMVHIVADEDGPVPVGLDAALREPLELQVQLAGWTEPPVLEVDLVAVLLEDMEPMGAPSRPQASCLPGRTRWLGGRLEVRVDDAAHPRVRIQPHP